ncbi:2-isopropylmalate synthase [Angelakisella massiliensis]|uniref:2-isopropylmalate synthase n=1 Tax=Angelakisella massiliensis TaxID=1871018 RepID=UPI0008F91FDB|nr:2-isopropylmalate synthase [Angelakisella massiliensis]
MRKITVFDTTLRDGEQAPGCTMNTREKLEFAKQLERLGVDVIEAGFPVASPDDFEAVSTIAREVRECTVAALCRCVQNDIDTAARALKEAAHPRLHVFIATSDLHLEVKLNITRQQALEKIRECVTYARSLCEDVEFSGEDATRSDREFLLECCNLAVDCGATTINIPDTVGYDTPEEMYDLIRYIRDNLHQKEKVRLSVHCHNDLGMAVANSLAALRAGADQVEGTINGIGERAGNAALEEVIMAIHTRGDTLGMETGINTRQIYRTSKLISTIIGAKIPANKPVVGRNAFSHEAGIHQHGVLKNPLTYEIMSPATIGIYESDLVLGKHSGRHAFEERVEELGYQLSGEALERAFKRFLDLADRKKSVTNKDIEAIVAGLGYALPETYRLHSFVVNSGTVISATAVVKLLKNGEEMEHVARGDGPVDAAYKAIERITKTGCQLVSYNIHAVTEGEDALGEVVVKLRKDGNNVTGRGISTDIFEASIKAYLNAVNKVVG